MEKITQKQIKELIKRILKGSYNDVMVLRNRLSLYGSGEIYQEDHLTLDIVLDLYDLFDLLLSGGDEESIKDKFLEIAEFYHWDFELNDFTDYEEEQDDASFYVWQLVNAKNKNKKENKMRIIVETYDYGVKYTDNYKDMNDFRIKAYINEGHIITCDGMIIDSLNIKSAYPELY